MKIKNVFNLVISTVDLTLNLALYIGVIYALIQLGMGVNLSSSAFMLLIAKNSFFVLGLWCLLFGIYLTFLFLWFKEVIRLSGEKSLRQIIRTKIVEGK